jgi:integrase
MKWREVDLENGIWTKPPSATKQKSVHRVPLSEDAVEIIARQPRGTFAGDFVFPGKKPGKSREGIRRPWARVCKAAGLKGVRIHDLRHTHASILVSSGLSLPVIGKILGHTQASTTHRYAHLADEPLRAAAELAAASIRRPKPAKIVQIKNR